MASNCRLVGIMVIWYIRKGHSITGVLHELTDKCRAQPVPVAAAILMWVIKSWMCLRFG